MFASPSGPGGQGLADVLNDDCGSFAAGQKNACGVFMYPARYSNPNSTYCLVVAL
jgi:hypothetical protein